MRLAVFVDGENLSSDYAAAIAHIAGGIARPIVSRVYGDAAKIAKWGEVAGFNLIHTGTGKNATDLLLCVDAMDYALTGGCDAVIIASSDRDFTHLALRLREKGLRIVGVGEVKTNAKYRAACSEFHALAQQPTQQPTKKPAIKPPAPQSGTPPIVAPAKLKVVATVSSPPKTALDDKIKAEIALSSQGGVGMELVALNSAMKAKHQFAISTTAEKNWRGYLSARPKLYALDPKGAAAKVRYLPKGFACVAQAAIAG